MKCDRGTVGGNTELSLNGFCMGERLERLVARQGLRICRRFSKYLCNLVRAYIYMRVIVIVIVNVGGFCMKERLERLVARQGLETGSAADIDTCTLYIVNVH